MTGIRFYFLIAGLVASVGGSRPASVVGLKGVEPVTRPAARAASDGAAANGAAAGKPEPLIQPSSWRAFYSKLPDTITLNFGKDTVAVLSSTGVPVLQSTYKYKNDIVTFKDIGGLNACADLTGSYHVRITGDTLTLVIDEDPCDARAGMLIIKPWIRKH